MGEHASGRVIARAEGPPDATEHRRPERVFLEHDATISDLRQVRNHGAPASTRLVLIVEDYEGTRETLAEIMKTQGYLVMEAADGQAALDVLSASPVDVLILDLAMPRVNGVELLRQIDPPPPVVVICSAFEYYPALEYYLLDEVRSQVGSKVFRSLRKPVAPARLISAVADAIEELERYDE